MTNEQLGQRLTEYLEKAKERKVYDHHLHADWDKNHFYIHPQLVGGETLDITWRSERGGAELPPIADTRKEEDNTRSPWEVGDGFVFANHGMLPHICNMTDFFNPEVTRANAETISAAPDLLEAGKGLRALIEKVEEILLDYLESNKKPEDVVDSLMELMDGKPKRHLKNEWLKAQCKAEGVKIVQ